MNSVSIASNNTYPTVVSTNAAHMGASGKQDAVDSSTNTESTIVGMNNSAIIIWTTPLRRKVKKSNSATDTTMILRPQSEPSLSSSMYTPLRSSLSCRSFAAAGDSPRRSKKCVTIQTIEIREYRRVLGDNPSVSSGPALSIDWTSVGTVSLPLDEYEKYRPPRRTRTELTVPARIRVEMLRDEGFTQDDIEYAIQRTDRIKQSRIHSFRTSQSRNPLALPFKVLSRFVERSSLFSGDRQLEALLDRAMIAESIRNEQQKAYLASLVTSIESSGLGEEDGATVARTVSDSSLLTDSTSSLETTAIYSE